MGERGRHKPPSKTYFVQFLSLPFLISVGLSFFIFLVYNGLTTVLFWDKHTLIQNDLGTIANYVSIYNKETADVVYNLNSIIQSYIKNENIFETQSGTLTTLRDDVTTKSNQLLLKDNKKYETLLHFLSDLHPYQWEVFAYLGQNTPKSYLVILQNTSEKRPNGWFFWSFAYIRLLHGKIMAFHMIDSYLGYKTMPRVSVTPPIRSAPLYNNQPFWRIAANKFWFTNIDGDILIQLYNKTFNDRQSDTYIPPELCKDMCHRPIEGVIFVKTDTLKKLMPWLDKKTRERQFLNASIDLIRKDNLPNKKEYYLKDSQQFFAQQQNNLTKNFITQFSTLASQYSFGVYIPSISTGLNTILTNYHFTTLPNSTTLYSRDTNKSFNKIDEFVHKTAILRNHIGDIIQEYTDNDQLDISWLTSGSYSLTLEYEINVPEQYKNFISWLETKYTITLTDRERGILSLQPTTLFDTVTTPKLRATKSQLYYPSNMAITYFTWDLFDSFQFQTPFGKCFAYSLETAKNTIKKSLIIDFTLQ